MSKEDEGLLKKQDYHAISNEEDAILQLRSIINKNNKGKTVDNFQNNFFTNLVKSLELGNDSEVYIDLDQINDIRYINKHFNNVYSNLTYGSSYFGVVETLSDWRKKQWMFKLPFIGWIYRIYVFMLSRVTPRIWGLKKIYFLLTSGRNRIVSKAEILGRLVYCGFEIIDCKPINNKHYFIAKKTREPLKIKPSYGPVFKMNRVGKKGKIIGVYKFRTMHPYSEFIHDYIIKTNGYNSKGKIKDDFRTSRWGKIMRKYWIDEIPQIYNVLRGEMKLVGVRPVSQVYFDSIPDELRSIRLQMKPGCIPPYVALDLGVTKEDVLNAETQYLRDKMRRPYFNDLIYFFKAIYKIIFRGRRSA